MRHFAKQVSNASKHPNWASHLLTAKVHEILQIEGKPAVLIRTALLAGLGSEQVLQLHKTQICSLSSLYCNCGLVHYSVQYSDMIFLSVPCHSDNTNCFAVMPLLVWRRFRNLESVERQIELANKGLGMIGMSFEELVQIFLAVQSRSNIGVFFPQYSGGISMFDAVQGAICSLVKRYCLAWEQQGVVLSFE